MSGTAAKLGPKSAYHHCTVLVDVNECVLHDALSSKAVNKLCKNNKVFHEAYFETFFITSDTISFNPPYITGER